MKKKIILLIATSLICLITIEYLSKLRIKNILDDYPHYTKEFIEFYDIHYKELNHLKSPPWKINDKNKFHELIYRELGTGVHKVLIQGDSWAEQIETTRNFKDKLIETSKNYDLQFIMAGASSYSPSIMSSQIHHQTYGKI